MAATVNIIIKGIALCYKKNIGGKNFWRVLFPFDGEVGEEHCHLVNFFWKKDDGPELPLLPPSSPPITKKSLAKKKGLITIEAPGATPPDKDETDNFAKFVFDLTNPDNAAKPKTHEKVDLIGKMTEEWRNGTVLMKIEAPAKFSVSDYMGELTNEKMELNGDNAAGQPLPPVEHKNPIAHSIKATIELAAGKLSVSDDTNKLVEIDAADGGIVTLIFDNDCRVDRNKNDMDMFYVKTIVDSDPTKAKRRFLVGKRPTKAKLKKDSIPTISLAEGKPCLAATISKSDDFPV